ncbi:hypothetical protein Bbelb_071660 [Branchiostoma belcheri]|nr:hypothetical protein Bbelb_071660 [Branchiostoma belcheri]
MSAHGGAVARMRLKRNQGLRLVSYISIRQQKRNLQAVSIASGKSTEFEGNNTLAITRSGVGQNAKAKITKSGVNVVSTRKKEEGRSEYDVEKNSGKRPCSDGLRMGGGATSSTR